MRQRQLYNQNRRLRPIQPSRRRAWGGIVGWLILATICAVATYQGLMWLGSR
jgi:hypothetical protein